MSVELTAVYQAVPEGFIAFVEELPGANTQGATFEEARVNLREAVGLVMEANRAMAEEDLAGATVIREPLRLTVCLVLHAARAVGVPAVVPRGYVAFVRHVHQHPGPRTQAGPWSRCPPSGRRTCRSDRRLLSPSGRR